MKTYHTPGPQSAPAIARIALALVAMVVIPSLLAAQSVNKIETRPLTPKEIDDFGLGDAVRSPGIPTVGIGDPVYLEVQIEIGTAVTEADVVWSILEQPAASAAALTASPLSPGIPVYNIGDREVAFAASRRFLQPDAAGQYRIRAEVPTAGGLLVLEKWVTAAQYVGVGTIDGATPVIPQCAVCHGEFSADNQVGGWEETLHATALVDEINNVGQPGDHFQQFCIECHSVGYNTDPLADNGGFDDVQADTGWMFPTGPASPGTSHWEQMPNALKQKSNVQCEACHGPGSEHVAAIDMAQTSISLGAGDCAQCHDAVPYHTKVDEWELSDHAVATRYPTGSESRLSCVRCHSGVGFIQYTDGVPVTDFNYEAITCQVCHDPHSGENHHQIRETGDVTLANGEVVSDGGAGKLCMNCHQSRRDAATYAVKYNFRHNPHHGPQGDMLAGKNAYEFGKFMPSSGHITATENGCIDCHLYEPGGGDPLRGLAGGHTFKVATEISGNRVEMVGACQSCHGAGLTTFNFTKADYDSDGTIEGVQDEIRGLMATLAQHLDVPGEGENASVSPDSSIGELTAAFNYNFVNEDRSFGIHNLTYTVAILRESIAAVNVDDYDEDGMNDTLEIFYFGSIDATPGADFDGDNLTNEEELAQGTHPIMWDTDNDGISDWSEILVGSNPLDPAETPDTAQRIFTAIEFLFYAETGKTYQIQYTSDLAAPAWSDWGEPVAGDDQFIQTFFSTIGKDKEFYRVVELE